MKAVVTGAAGFIGSHLTERLLNDGWTVIGTLKSSQQTAQIPVVVLTGSPIDSMQDKVRMMGMGVQQFLTKPVSIELLVREIQRHMA